MAFFTGMQDISKAMNQVVKGMGAAMKSMDPEKIAKTMETFEQQFEDMDVRSGYMESTMEATTAMTTPPEQVDSLIQMVAEEAGLQLAGELDNAGPVGTGAPAQAEAAPAENDFEARMAALKK
jgi:charged multivesicular body protein 1